MINLSEFPIKLRHAEKADEGFIYSTWLKSYRQSDWAKDMSNDVFFNTHKEIVMDLIEKATVMMIVDEEDDQHLIGYVCYETVGVHSLIHFVYVKFNYRKLGLLSAVISSLNLLKKDKINFITHLPRSYSVLKTKKNLEYNPYLILRGFKSE